MTRRSIVAILEVLLGVAGGLEAQDVRYEVTPVPRDSGMDLRVLMTFPGDSSGRTRVALPRDRFGVPAMHRFVRDLDALSGSAWRFEAGDSTLLVSHAAGAEVSLRYTIRYDSARVGFVPFGPSVDRRHYHFLGSQWMARVGADDSTRAFTVQVAPGSFGRAHGGSFGIGPGRQRMRATFEEMEWTVIAGGDYREDRFACAGRPVTTLVYGTFQLPDDTLFAMARRIVCGERDAWGDHAQPFYSVVITARQRVRAGASYLNAFSCFARPDSRPDQLALLLAHETMHAWLPRRLRVVPGADEPPPVEFSSFHDIRYDWFHEGFTEYLARRILVRLDLVSPEWFVERLNDDLERLTVHPYRTTPVRGLEDAARSGRFTNFHQRLSYLRGLVLAFNWDAAIQRASAGRLELMDAMRVLLDSAAVSGGRLPRPVLERALQPFGVKAGADVARFALQGAAIPVDSAGLGPEWALRHRPVPKFEPGFDVVASLTVDTVLGVIAGGPAHAAGLRTGMPIVRTDNTWRWDQAWDASRPLTIVVREPSGERTITVPAVPGSVRVPYFERAP